MATPENRSLGQIAQQEMLQTQQAREAMGMLGLSQLLSHFSEKMLQNKEIGLASFAAMVSVVLLPRGIELANTVLGTYIDSATASMIASQGLPMVTGALTGDYLRPISGTIDAIQHKRALDEIRAQGDSKPQELVTVLACYSGTVKPKELESWVRNGRLSKEYEGDDRYTFITTLYEAKKASQMPTAPETRQGRRVFERELQKQTVKQFMQAQIEGQRLRRTPSYVAKEVFRKVGDWTVGVISLGAGAHVVKEVAQDASTAGSVGLIDDALVIVAMFLSPITKRVLDMFKTEVTKPKGEQHGVPIPEVPQISRFQPTERPVFDHVVNYNARKL